LSGESTASRFWLGEERGLQSYTRVPIAAGERFGYKWDINALIEKQLIDYTRVTLPNVDGISECMKIVALAETHHILATVDEHGPTCQRPTTSKMATSGRMTALGWALRSTSAS
jgi:L-alanine-DL-glutamate epimerase-like enolase superfamily enzyme